MPKKTLKIGNVVVTPEGTRMVIREVNGHKITCNDLSFGEIIEALNRYRLRCVEKEIECTALRDAIENIKIWCEAATCEICGKKKMVDTDCYDYVKKVLKYSKNCK